MVGRSGPNPNVRESHEQHTHNQGKPNDKTGKKEDAAGKAFGKAIAQLRMDTFRDVPDGKTTRKMDLAKKSRSKRDRLLAKARGLVPKT